MRLHSLISFSLILQIVCFVLGEDDSLYPTETRLGMINGYTTTVDVFGSTNRVVRYLGIPYAEPPLGPRRLQKPTPLQHLSTSPYNATYLRPSCIQFRLVTVGFDPYTSEDCLYLNIFRPLPEKSLTTENLPVIIYIHSGAFVLGSGRAYSGDTLASFGKVVVVSINYRLGLFGFFSSGDEHAPGNYGLWDQHVAIQWVHQHIGAFGGDPRKVTIFGHSAGSASVVHQSLYPGNEGLFQRAIASSGSVTSPWARTKNPRYAANKLGRLLGCNHGSTQELVDCIRRVPYTDIDSVYNEGTNGFQRFPFDFTPSVDGEFVKVSTDELIMPGNDQVKLQHSFFSSLDFLTGITSAEGSFLLTTIVGVEDGEHFAISREVFENTVIQTALESLYVPKAVKDLVSAEYSNWTYYMDDNSQRNAFIDFSSDHHFDISTITTGTLHAGLSRKANTYFYYFDAILTCKMDVLDFSWLKGAGHGGDIFVAFGYNKDLVQNFVAGCPELPQWEQDISKALMGMLTNFAKTGNPNLPFDVKQYTRTEWPAFHPDTEHYLIIQRDGALVGQRLKPKAVNFWTNIVPSLVKTVCKPCGEISTNGQTGDNACYSDGTCDP